MTVQLVLVCIYYKSGLLLIERFSFYFQQTPNKVNCFNSLLAYCFDATTAIMMFYITSVFHLQTFDILHFWLRVMKTTASKLLELRLQKISLCWCRMQACNPWKSWIVTGPMLFHLEPGKYQETQAIKKKLGMKFGRMI